MNNLTMHLMESSEVCSFKTRKSLGLPLIWNSRQLSTWVHKCHYVVDDIYIWHYTPFFSKRNTKNFFTVWNNWFFTPAETWLWQLPEHGFIFFKTFESELWIFTLSNSLWALYPQVHLRVIKYSSSTFQGAENKRYGMVDL